MLLIAVIDERVEPRDAFGNDIAAATAIAAVGTAERDEFLPAERDAARAAIAGADEHLRLVEEFHAATSIGERAGRGNAPSLHRPPPTSTDLPHRLSPQADRGIRAGLHGAIASARPAVPSR